MATNLDDNFVPSTKEYLVMQKYFNRLHHVIDNPVSLAINMFSEGLISDWTLMKASCETGCVIVRNYYLLNGMKGAVVCDPNNLMKIISILEEHPPLDSIAQEMKKDYDTDIPPDCQLYINPSINQSITVKVDEKVHKDLNIMQGKLGALVLEVQKSIVSAGIDVDELKQLLILSYPSEELKQEMRRAQDNNDVFVAVRKLCSPVNFSVLVAIVDHFKLSDALTAIKAYETEEQIYRKKLLSSTFAQELHKEAESIGRNPTVKNTITLHLNWSSPQSFTIKEFENIVKDVFSDLFQYIHIIKVEVGSVIVTMYAPDFVMRALIVMAKTKLQYLFDIGITLLQIGDEIILDLRENEGLHKDVDETDTYKNSPGSITPISCHELDPDVSRVNSPERKMEVRQRQLVQVSTTASYVQKVGEGDGAGDLGEDSPSGLFTRTWRDPSLFTADVLIIGSFGGDISQNIQVAKKRVPSDYEGSDEWMMKEINIIVEKMLTNPYCNRVVVFSELPGNECHSKDYYLDMIRSILIDCKQDGVTIWYNGHGEKNTGNWCFKDGVITFQDIFGLYMDCFSGKTLNIMCDCSYSGNWINECIKELDDLGIPSCGHHTRKQKILLDVWCSCKADEEATGLCYITEANIFDEHKKLVVNDCNNKLSSGQTTKSGNFRRIYCGKTATEPCEVNSTCTWKDRLLHLVCLIRSNDKIKQTWHYIQVDEDQLEAFKTCVSAGNIKISDYGTILFSGWGPDPPESIKHEVDIQFSSIIDLEY